MLSARRSASAWRAGGIDASHVSRGARGRGLRPPDRDCSDQPGAPHVGSLACSGRDIGRCRSGEPVEASPGTFRR